MMQNGLGESFWDAHGVEIGPCTIFKKMTIDHFHKNMQFSIFYDNRKAGVIERTHTIYTEGQGDT